MSSVSRKLIRILREWQNSGLVSRKRISWLKNSMERKLEGSSKGSSASGKGNFVVYTIDGRRFEIPLAYLSSNIFQELFRMSEEEFGLASDGPITLPCDGAVMDYIVSLVQRGVAKDMERALINSIATSHRCAYRSYSFRQRQNGLQVLVCA